LEGYNGTQGFIISILRGVWDHWWFDSHPVLTRSMDCGSQPPGFARRIRFLVAGQFHMVMYGQWQIHTPARPGVTGGTLHLQIDDTSSKSAMRSSNGRSGTWLHAQIHRLSNEATPHLRDDQLLIHIELGLDVVAVNRTQLTPDLVELARAGVVDVGGMYLRAGVEGVEAYLAGPLPLGKVNLGWPSVHIGKPERGPGAATRGGLELASEVVAATARDVKVLFRVDGTAQVLDVDLLSAMGSLALTAHLLGDDGQNTVCELDVLAVHACSAVVISPPWVVVLPLQVKVLLRVEARRRDDGGGSKRGRQQSCREKQRQGGLKIHPAMVPQHRTT
jgi:hypothetical protein